MDALSDHVIDTIALVRYLEDDLPSAANRIFREAEDGRGRLFVPEIALGEFAYVALRGRLRLPNPRAAVEEVLEDLLSSASLLPSHMSPSAWRAFLDLGIPELHDRMIAADALSRGIPLITNDPSFRKIEGLRVVWR